MSLVRRIRPLTAAALVALFGVTSAGCFGRFHLVRTVYDFNASVQNKFARSLVTWAMVIIPVYAVAGLVDFLILNTIEFWSGSSALADQTLPDGTQMQLARISDDVMRVRLTRPNGAIDEVEFVKVSENAGLVRRPSGQLVGTVERTADGQIISRPVAQVATTVR